MFCMKKLGCWCLSLPWLEGKLQSGQWLFLSFRGTAICTKVNISQKLDEIEIWNFQSRFWIEQRWFVPNIIKKYKVVWEWSPKSCYFWQIMNYSSTISYFLLKFGTNYRCTISERPWKFQLSILSGFWDIFTFVYVAVPLKDRNNHWPREGDHKIKNSKCWNSISTQ